jgi:hypothetical protein
LRGEVDGRANYRHVGSGSAIQDWLGIRGLMDFHAILEAPKGLKHDRFGHSPGGRSPCQIRKRKPSSRPVADIAAYGLALRAASPERAKDRVDAVQECDAQEYSKMPSSIANTARSSAMTRAP